MSCFCELLSLAIYVVGLLTVLAFLFDNFKSLISIIKALLEPYFQPHLPQTLLEKFGKWAVVTGATDGIGREYAKELAKHGINVVLISRTKEKLVQLANEIENVCKVKTKCIIADFSKGQEIYQHIEHELSGVPIGILVNNVGVNYEYPDEFSQQSTDILWQLINVNVAAATILSHMVIPIMKKQGKGAIVNISSGSELQPMPLIAPYAASKRYIKSLSLALQYELAPYNITVQTVTPLFVVTKINQFSRNLMRGNILIPQVQRYTKSLVYTLGKTSETTGYWSHGVQYFFMKIVPEIIRLHIGHLLSQNLRAEYFATQQEKAE